jgi:hypothetical protein
MKKEICIRCINEYCAINKLGWYFQWCDSDDEIWEEGIVSCNCTGEWEGYTTNVVPEECRYYLEQIITKE